MISRRALLLSLCHVTCTVGTLTGQKIANYFRSTLSPGSEVRYSDGNHTVEMNRRWDAYRPPEFIVSVKPMLDTDIQKVIQYACQSNVSFLATGGGHGTSITLSTLRNGVELDLGNFNRVSVDAANSQMTIGGSVRFANITRPLHSVGKEIPVSTCACIGVTGATLGGGIGPYSGLHGAISDSLSSLEMVTGTGELLTVSASQNPDLFWGMKGAGFNFGVVTSLVYDLYDAPNSGNAMNADLTFLASQNRSLWSIAKSFARNQPKELSISFSVSYNATMEQIVLVGNFIYAGPLEQGKQLIKPFLDLEPTNTNISYLQWPELQDAAFYGAIVQGCIPGNYYIQYGVNLFQVDVDNLVKVIDFLNESMSQTPALQTSVITLTQYSPYGFHLHPENSSAFPFRDTIIYTEVQGVFFNAIDGDTVDTWGRKVNSLLQEGSGKDLLEVYVHFAYGDEGNDSWYTKAKIPRLRNLKKKYDPHSLFSHYNAIEVV